MILPDHCLRLVSPADRAKLGLVTAEEAFAAQQVKSEKELQQLLYTWLTAHRGVNRIVRSRMDRKTTRDAGDPDFLFLYWVPESIHRDGRFVPLAWEIKTSTGKPHAAQIEAAISFAKDGWHWSLIRSFAEAKQVLDSL